MPFARHWLNQRTPTNEATLAARRVGKSFGKESGKGFGPLSEVPAAFAVSRSQVVGSGYGKAVKASDNSPTTECEYRSIVRVIVECRASCWATLGWTPPRAEADTNECRGA